MFQSRWMILLASFSVVVGTFIAFRDATNDLSAQPDNSAQILKTFEWQRSVLTRKNFRLPDDFRAKAQIAFDAAREKSDPQVLSAFLTPTLNGFSQKQIEQISLILLRKLPVIQSKTPSDDEREWLVSQFDSQVWSRESDRLLIAQLWRNELEEDLSVEQFSALAALTAVPEMRPLIKDEEALAQVSSAFASVEAFVWSGTSLASNPEVLQSVLKAGFVPEIETDRIHLVREKIDAPVSVSGDTFLKEVYYLSSPLSSYDREKLKRHADPEDLDERALDSFELVGFMILAKGALKCSLPIYGQGLKDEVLFWAGDVEVAERAVAIDLKTDRRLKFSFFKDPASTCDWKAPVDELNVDGSWVDQMTFNYSLNQFQVASMKDPLGSSRSVALAYQVAGVRRGVDYPCPYPESKVRLLTSSDGQQYSGGLAIIDNSKEGLSFSWKSLAEVNFSARPTAMVVAMAHSPKKTKRLELSPRDNRLVFVGDQVFSWFAREIMTDPY